MRLYYASDVHGSEVCWRKFLNAGKYYKVDALIMGGDITGKAIVPITCSPGGAASATLFGKSVTLDGNDQIVAFEKSVRDGGMYPYRAQPDELANLDESDNARQRLFDEVVRSELERWLQIAADKHDPACPIYVMPGNDDPWFIDEVLSSCQSIVSCEGRVVDLQGVEMISASYANPTPWDSPRELPEDDLYAHLHRLAEAVKDPASAVFNLHAPPYGTGLDDAPLLDETLRPITHLGQVETGPVGSHAVRRILSEFQPSVSLHGHIHESRAAAKVGRTVAINPGSEYGTGRVHGAIVELARGEVRSHQLVSG